MVFFTNRRWYCRSSVNCTHRFMDDMTLWERIRVAIFFINFSAWRAVRIVSSHD